MNRSKRYSPEIRERAVRMVFEHQSSGVTLRLMKSYRPFLQSAGYLGE